MHFNYIILTLVATTAAAPTLHYTLNTKKCVHGRNIKLYSNAVAPKTVQQCASLCDANQECKAFEYGHFYNGHLGSYKAGDCQLQSSSAIGTCNGADYNLDLYVKQTATVQLSAEQKGFCVKSNNQDENSGVVRIRQGDFKTDAKKRECVQLCREYSAATVYGCETIWDQSNRGCYVHTSGEALHGNKVQRHSCWTVIAAANNLLKPPPKYDSKLVVKCAEDKEHDHSREANLDCGAGKVISDIRFASYGTPHTYGTCDAGEEKAADQSFGFTLGNCHSSVSKKVVEGQCVGQRSCMVNAANNEDQVDAVAGNQKFGDPCHGIKKHLMVEYTCAAAAVRDEESIIAIPRFSSEQRGYCVKSNNRDENSGVFQLGQGDYQTDAKKKECLQKCRDYTAATVYGCEVIWDQSNRGCYVHTSGEKLHGNGVSRHSCWAVMDADDTAVPVVNYKIRTVFTTGTATTTTTKTNTELAGCRCASNGIDNLDESTRRYISVCKSGCGNPKQQCHQISAPNLLGCQVSSKSCGVASRGRDVCTCNPDNDSDDNTMTYDDCDAECKSLDMHIVSSQAERAAAVGTGCNINGIEMWKQSIADVVADDDNNDGNGDCSKFTDCDVKNPCLKIGGHCAPMVNNFCPAPMKMCSIWASRSTGAAPSPSTAGTNDNDEKNDDEKNDDEKNDDKNDDDGANNDDKNENTRSHVERYVVKHTITLRGMNVDTFNNNPTVIQSFRTTVSDLLMVDPTTVHHVRACVLGATDAECPKGIETDTSAQPTTGPTSGGGSGGGGRRRSRRSRRRLGDTDECEIRYEIIVDNKTIMNNVKATILGENYQKKNKFSNAFVSEMKKENVDAVIANQITAAEPNEKTTQTTVVEEEKENNGNSDGADGATPKSSGSESKSFTNNVGGIGGASDQTTTSNGSTDNSTEMVVIGVLAGLIGVGVLAFIVVFYVQRNKVQQSSSNQMVIDMGTVTGNFDGGIPIAAPAIEMSAMSASGMNAPPVAFVFDAMPDAGQVQGGAQKSNVDFAAAQRRFSLYRDVKN